MTSLSVKAIDPLTVDFENPGSIKGALLKKLKKKKEELEQNNLDNFVMRNIDKSDLPVLLKETRAACLKSKNKLLKSFQQKLQAAKKEDKQDEITKLEQNIEYLSEPSDSLLADMAWREHVLHCVTGLQKGGEEAPRLTELAREVICAEPVRAALQEARLAVKRRRRQLEQREKKRKRVNDGSEKEGKEETEAAAKPAAPPTAKELRAQAEAKKEAAARAKALTKLTVGTVLMCAVQGVSEFGVFLETYFADARLKAMCHLSRVHKLGKVVHAEQLAQRYQFGDRVTAVVIEVDQARERVKVSFRDSDFAAHTKMTHKHLRGDQRATHIAAEDAQKETNRTLSSVRVSSLADEGKNRKALFEEALSIVRKLNCRSTNEKHKGKRMSAAMRVKLTAEFLGLDVQREYNRFMFREKLRKLRNKGGSLESLRKKKKTDGDAGEADEDDEENHDEDDEDMMGFVAQAQAQESDESDEDGDESDDAAVFSSEASESEDSSDDSSSDSSSSSSSSDSDSESESESEDDTASKKRARKA